MVKMREELSDEDLVSLTVAVRKLKPEMENHVCVGVEAPQMGDKNVVFHMRNPNNEVEENSIIMISADLILLLFGGTGNVAKRNV
jgi:peptide deformylase